MFLLLITKKLFNLFNTLRPNGNKILVPEEEVKVEKERMKVGAIVSFSFKIQSRRDMPVGGVTIYRVREDVTWRDVVLNHFRERRFLNGISLLLYLSSLPLLSSFLLSTLFYFSPFHSVLHYHAIHFFPFLFLLYFIESSQLKGFSSQPPGYWTQTTMRQFLIDFMKNKKKMDPFNPDSWYSTSYGEIRQTPVCFSFHLFRYFD